MLDFFSSKYTQVTLSGNSIYMMYFEQDTTMTNISYKPIFTLNIVIGLLGGLSGAVFSVIPWLVGWYQDYRV
jgi:hypothetical protein